MFSSNILIGLVAAASFGGFNFFNWFQAPPPPMEASSTEVTNEIESDEFATGTLPVPDEKPEGFSFFAPSTWRPAFGKVQQFFGGEPKPMGPPNGAGNEGTSTKPMPMRPGMGGQGQGPQGGMPPGAVQGKNPGMQKPPMPGNKPMGSSSNMIMPSPGMAGQGQNGIDGYKPPIPTGGREGGFPGDEGASQGMPGPGGMHGGMTGGGQNGMVPPPPGIPGMSGGGFESQGAPGNALQQNMPSKPPQAAIDACKGKSVGTACKFTDRDQTISGSCITPPNMNLVVCAPAKMMPM